MNKNDEKWESLFPEKVEFEILLSITPKDMHWRMWHVATEEQRKKYIDYQLLRAGIDVKLLRTDLDQINKFELSDEFEKRPIYRVEDIFVDNIEDAKALANLLKTIKVYKKDFIGYVLIHKEVKQKGVIHTEMAYIDDAENRFTEAAKELDKIVLHDINLRKPIWEEKEKAKPILKELDEMGERLTKEYDQIKNMYNLYKEYITLAVCDETAMSLLSNIHKYSKEDIGILKELLEIEKQIGIK